MGLYLVTERLVERCNYYHLVEAENEEEACEKVDTGESSVVGSDFVGWVGDGKITEVPCDAFEPDCPFGSLLGPPERLVLPRDLSPECIGDRSTFGPYLTHPRSCSIL